MLKGSPLSALTVADEARLTLSPTLDPNKRGQLGQFMTPAPIARFMAGLFTAQPENVRLLDAGAGAGALTAAFVQERLMCRTLPHSIEVAAFEVDPGLISSLKGTLQSCREECEAAGVSFFARVVNDDFILRAAEPLLHDEASSEQYTAAILNPPYAKINSGSVARRSLSKIGIETSNLYTAFVSVALKQLLPGGELVAITPRSFCNGSYFERFRRFMLDVSALRRLHVYESRKSAFSDDQVLQENVVFALMKGEPQPEFVEISSSFGADANAIAARAVPFSEVVLPNDPYKFIRLAVSEADTALALRVRALQSRLVDLGLQVSTGRVVDFRAREALRPNPEVGTVPLIYPCHFEKGFVSWPNINTKKANALVLDAGTEGLTVPAGTYILTKRFTSKEERRRLVATVYDPDRIRAERVGFENHLNYFHKGGQGLDPKIARGLALYLNSTAVDQYFRQFSGHTQVNATDLRNLHYPSLDQLYALSNFVTEVMPEQASIDQAVDDLLPME